MYDNIRLTSDSLLENKQKHRVHKTLPLSQKLHIVAFIKKVTSNDLIFVRIGGGGGGGDWNWLWS